MASPASRMLRLIALLQTRRTWSGAELAERLGVDRRSLRRDVERLRGLGYPVRASSGVGGGYRLAAGAQALPLLFEEEEAVAVVVALRAAAASMGGLEDTALRVLAKLDPLLPARARQQAGALHAVTVSLGHDAVVPETRLLVGIAAACRDRRLLGFAYRDHQGQASERWIEPLRLVNFGRRWYLLGWDRDRADWRTFRVDRIDAPLRLGDLTAARPPPRDPAAMVREAVRFAPFPLQVRLRLRGDLADLAARIPPWCGVLEAGEDGDCRLAMGAESPALLASELLALGVPFELIEGQALAPALLAALREAAACLGDGAA